MPRTAAATRRAPGRTGAACAVALAFCGVAAGARADRFDDAARKLRELEGDVQTLVTRFQEKPADPHNADRRVIDAQTLFELKQYADAAVMALDVIQKHKGTRAYDDAIVLLGEALYQTRDYNSARRYFRQAVEKDTGSRKEQAALQRLVEIALRTDEYEGIDEILDRLARIPPERLEPFVPYVRGKYFYFRDKLDDAAAIFAAIPPASPHHVQARYFLGTIEVKRGDLAAAAAAFDGVLKLQPKTDNDKDVQALARLALGRMHYERDQFDQAKAAYAAVPKDSKYFADAAYESAWNSIKAEDFAAAHRALDIILLSAPDSPRAPELRLLLGNLSLRMQDYFPALSAFGKTLDEFEPIYRDLKDRLDKARVDPLYFDQLLGKNFEKFDVALFIPQKVIPFAKAEPEVDRILTLAGDVGHVRQDIQDGEKLLARLERAVQGVGKIGIFADLGSARTKSTEILNQTVDIRQRFLTEMRELIAPVLGDEDRVALASITAERTALEQQLRALPMTKDALDERGKRASKEVTALDGRTSELNVEIQALEAQLVAIEQYFKTTSADPQQASKLRAEDVLPQVSALKDEIAALRGKHEQLLSEVDEVGRDMRLAGAAAENERSATVRLSEVMKAEQEIYLRARTRLDPSRTRTFDDVARVLDRANAVQTELAEFDGRLEGIADRRLTDIRDAIAGAKTELAQESAKLEGVLVESGSVSGGLAHAVLAKVTERFYDIVVESDVGVIDVAWGLKDRKTSAVSDLVNQQNDEIKAVEADFKSLIGEGGP